MAGLTERKTKPASCGLAELGNKVSRAGGGCRGYVVGGCRGYVVGGWLD